MYVRIRMYECTYMYMYMYMYVWCTLEWRNLVWSFEATGRKLHEIYTCVHVCTYVYMYVCSYWYTCVHMKNHQ